MAGVCSQLPSEAATRRPAGRNFYALPRLAGSGLVIFVSLLYVQAETDPSMAGLIDRFLGKIFKGSATGDSKRKKLCHNIRFNENPEEYWNIVGDLGDGAFGKVHKVCICYSLTPFVINNLTQSLFHYLG